jgi:hypothetical protein
LNGKRKQTCRNGTRKRDPAGKVDVNTGLRHLDEKLKAELAKEKSK